MEKQLWNDFEMEEFIFEERKARIVYPKAAPVGKLLLKTEYWDAFPKFEIEMVERGYYLCNIEHQTRWAPDEETIIMANFVRFVANKLGIEPKCLPVGMSCGGLQAARLAEMFPEMVPVLYIDAPVLNILSFSGHGAAKLDGSADSMWQELVNTYNFNKSSVLAFRNSPIDHMDVLIENNIPIIMVVGNADTTVIYEENGKVLEDYYNAHGGTLKVIKKTMCGHHPHSLSDPTPIIEFVEKYL